MQDCISMGKSGNYLHQVEHKSSCHVQLLLQPVLRGVHPSPQCPPQTQSPIFMAISFFPRAPPHICLEMLQYLKLIQVFSVFPSLTPTHLLFVGECSRATPGSVLSVHSSWDQSQVLQPESRDSLRSELNFRYAPLMVPVPAVYSLTAASEMLRSTLTPTTSDTLKSDKP